MKKAVIHFTALAGLSLAFYGGLHADSKRSQNPKEKPSVIKQKQPRKSTESVYVDTLQIERSTPQPDDEPGYRQEVNWHVLSSGGRPVTGEDFALSGTLGQFAVGVVTSGDLGIRHGYWQDFGKSYICGDADASGDVDIDDPVYILAYAFLGGPAPIPVESADADCSGDVDIDDVVYILAYAFLGGPPPCDPDNNGEPDC